MTHHTSSRKGPSRILIIDDESDMLTNYQRLLKRAGHDCLATNDPSNLEQMIGEFQPHLVLTDLVMPEMSGMEVLKKMRQLAPQTPVILVTGYGSVENAVEAMKEHAADFLTKPFSVEDLLQKIQQVLANSLLGDSSAPPEPPSKLDSEWRRGIVGASPAWCQVLDLTRKVASSDVNVLITGESGSGKEVISRAIHRLSDRRNEIFVPVDCASLPENLLESELFGYCKGSFTGASSDKMGLFEFAHKGTLFLDEIGEMPTALQSKLLRVLQERRFRPIGGRHEIDVDVRVIAATNQDMDQALREKRFRSDLFYRLNVVTICLPTLKDRPEDIVLLAEHFLREFCSSNHREFTGITRRALRALKAHDWPGNVRELQNVIARAATLSTGSIIDLNDLPESLQISSDESAEIEHEDFHSERSEGYFESREQLVRGFEKEYLESLLIEHDFNISAAAMAAGCHRRTLYRIIHRHGLDLDQLRHRKDSSHSAM